MAKSNIWGPEVNEYAELISDVRELKTDMYQGKGKDNPSVTTRLALLEDSQERMEKMTDAKFQKYDSLLNKGLVMSYGSAIAVIGFLIKVIFFPHAQ